MPSAVDDALGIQTATLDALASDSSPSRGDGAKRTPEGTEGTRCSYEQKTPPMLGRALSAGRQWGPATPSASGLGSLRMTWAELELWEG